MSLLRRMIRPLLLFLFIALPFFVIGQINAAFTVNTNSGCAPLIVSFTNQSTAGSGVTLAYQWDDGTNFSILQNPVLAYSIPGTYVITLTAYDQNNTSSFDTETMSITVHNKPNVVLSYSPTSGCAPLEVVFNSNSSTAGSGTITSRFWDYGDGSTSSSANPTHTYTSAGNFVPTLKITNSFGCHKTVSGSPTIMASGGPIASFSSSTHQACAPPLTVSFTSTTTGGNTPYSYNWDLDVSTSSATNPSASYTAAGFYDITLIVTDNAGCKDTLVSNDYVVITAVQADFEVQSPDCKGEPISITNQTLGASNYAWNWGDNTSGSGVSPNKSYSAGGTYTITLTATSGTCSDSHTETVQIQEITPSFTSSPNYSCEEPHLTYYTNTSTVNFGTINYHEWRWGIFDQISIDSFLHSEIDTSGVDSIIRDQDDLGYWNDTLIVVSNIGCTAMLVKPNNVLIEVMQTSFYADPNRGCAPALVDYYDLSVPTNTYPITSWNWDFGNGTTSTLQNPTNISYIDTGCYFPKLIIENAFGCKDSMVTAVPAEGVCYGTLPTAGAIFTEDTMCANDSVWFYNDPIDSFANEFEWYFSDGSTFNGETIHVSLDDTGWISLQYVVGHHGCRDTIDYDSAIYVNGPIVEYSVTMDCDTPMVRWFNAYVFKDVERFYWDFGDNSPLDSVNQNPVHLYSNTGSYFVNLHAYNDANGCDFQHSGTVVVKQLQPEFTVWNFNELPVDSVACLPSGFQFDATPSIDEMPMYQWIINNDTAGFSYPIHSYYFTTPGHFDVKLILQDANGCIKTKTHSVFLSDPDPNFTFDYTGGCDPVTIAFEDQSSSDTNIVTRNWNFGDGGNAQNIENPNHSYVNPATYFVTLQITDSIGCSASKTKPVTIKFPFVSFIADSIVCELGTVNFLNQSVGDSLTYFWNFGNGVTNTVQNPPGMIYVNPGEYVVYLAIEDDLGCLDTAFANISVKPKPIPNFFADTNVSPCLPLFVTFSDSSIGDIEIWQWEFGDATGSVLLDTSVAFHTYTQPGIFDVKLTVETEFGCKASKTKTGFIQVSGPYAEFGVAPDTACVDVPIDFFVTERMSMAKYTWVFGDGYDTTVIGSIDSIQHAYDRVGIRTPVVVYYDSLNICQIPFLDTIYIHEVKAKFAFRPDSVGCGVLNARMINNSLGADSWRWDFGDGRESSEFAPLIYFPEVGEFDVELYIVNEEYGCEDSISKRFVVHPVPTVLARADTLICRGDSVLVYGKTLADSVTWNWKLKEYVEFDTAQITWAFPDTSTYLKVYATDTNGCAGVDSIRITVQDTPRVEIFDDTTVIIGEIVVLNPKSRDRLHYTWIPPGVLSCDTCRYPTYVADGNQVFYLVVRDIYGCFGNEYSFNINVEEKYSLDVPDAFTPNGDGVNDIIYARGWGIKELQEFRIYNRWGQEVFSTNSIHQGWDGTFRGKEQGMDTYAYIVKVLRYNGKEDTKEGFVELVR